MATKQKPALWVNEVFKVMTPKRCCKNNINDKKRGSIERVQGIIKDGHFPVPLAKFSPKKQRRAHEVENVVVAQQPSMPSRRSLPLFPPNIDIDFDFQTPPPINRVIHSPPRLEQQRKTRTRDHQGEAVMGHLQLPTLQIPSDDLKCSRGFHLNPRFGWNPSVTSRQLKGTARTLSFLWNERNAFDDTRVNSTLDSHEGVESGSTFRENVIKPIPIRHRSVTATATAATVGSSATATTTFHDNTTFHEDKSSIFRTIAEEPCCGYFCPNQYSAFDSVESHNKNS